jgi:hypothetical protein
MTDLNRRQFLQMLGVTAGVTLLPVVGSQAEQIMQTVQDEAVEKVAENRYDVLLNGHGYKMISSELSIDFYDEYSHFTFATMRPSGIRSAPQVKANFTTVDYRGEYISGEIDIEFSFPRDGIAFRGKGYVQDIQIQQRSDRMITQISLKFTSQLTAIATTA